LKKSKTLGYYDRYSIAGLFYFFWKAVSGKEKLRKRSMLNRFRDYQGLNDQGDLLALHRQINGLLEKAASEWNSYDYGEGYFYQSFQKVGISGLRITEQRVRAMNLAQRLKNRRVLEIGCNTGFVALSVADTVENISGFDINPCLVQIGQAVAEYLKISNVSLLTSSFEAFQPDRKYDVVLSFANHDTYDGNTKQSLQDYFLKCRNVLKTNGLLLFESHPPQLEGDGFKNVCTIINEFFIVQEKKVLSYGTFLDRGRTFIVGVRK